MKKTLVALAALAATGAFAQSSVTITGIMDAYYGVGKQFGQDVSLVTNSGARTTSVRFSGTEDLGGGLAANFTYEVQPWLNNGQSQTSTVAAGSPVGFGSVGEAFVGISGGLGTLRLGSSNSASLAVATNGTQFGTGIGSGYSTILGSSAAATRYNSSIRYLTPVMSGFQGSLLYVPNQNAAYGATAATQVNSRAAADEFGLSWAQGAWNVQAALLALRNSTVAATNPDLTTNVQSFSVRYNFGPAIVGYARQNTTNDAALSTTTAANALSLVVPLGANRVMLNAMNRKTDSAVATNSTINGETSTFYGLAFERDLSKRTFVYVRGETATMNDLNSNGIVVNGTALANNTNANFDRARSLLTVGISHQF